MAIRLFYRLEVKPISRSKGHSATAAAAYRSASRIVDDRTGDVHDYRNRRGVEGGHLFGADGSAALDMNRADIWNAAEAAERKKNARVARDIIVALPHQLDTQQRRQEAAMEMAAALARRYGTIVDANVHAPNGKGDRRNFHVHLLMATRDYRDDDFGDKLRQLDDRKTGPQEITAIRQMWADIGTRHLRDAGYDLTLDPRSRDAQGLDQVPEPKIGPMATAFERAGRESKAGRDARLVRQLNAARAQLKEEGRLIEAAELLRDWETRQLTRAQIENSLEYKAKRANTLAQTAQRSGEKAAFEMKRRISKHPSGTPAPHLNPPGMGNPSGPQDSAIANEDARHRKEKEERARKKYLARVQAIKQRRAAKPIQTPTQAERTSPGPEPSVVRKLKPARDKDVNAFNRQGRKDGKAPGRTERLAKNPALAAKQQQDKHLREKAEQQQKQDQEKQAQERKHQQAYGASQTQDRKRKAELDAKEQKRSSVERALAKLRGQEKREQAEKEALARNIANADMRIQTDRDAVQKRHQAAEQAQQEDQQKRVEKQQETVEHLEGVQTQERKIAHREAARDMKGTEAARTPFNREAKPSATPLPNPASPPASPEKTWQSNLEKTFGRDTAAREEFKRSPKPEGGGPENDNVQDGPKPTITHTRTF